MVIVFQFSDLNGYLDLVSEETEQMLDQDEDSDDSLDQEET